MSGGDVFQAGQTIQQEDLAMTFERLMYHSPAVSEAINKVMVAAQYRAA